MMLREVAVVPEGVLPVQAAKDHLRLGTGFADDGMQDGLVSAYLRAAIAVIEGRTGKALLTRDFVWKVDRLRQSHATIGLPVAPTNSVTSVKLIDREGLDVELDAQKWRLVPDFARPKLKFLGGLPRIPEAGLLEVRFNAGFGASWSGVPPDLAQAVLMLAGEFYEKRHSAGEESLACPQPYRP